VTVSFLTDEHVPRVFVTLLRSSGYPTVRATDEFGEGTNDRKLLAYCAEQGHVFITHDKKDFTGEVGDTVDHAGIIIYTAPVFLRDSPADAVQLIKRVLAFYTLEELAGERVWLDQWRDLLE
jgi:hypothetical protein